MEKWKKNYYVYNSYAIIDIMKTRQKWAVIAIICFAAGFPVAVPYFIMTSKVSAENMDFAFDIAESLAISLTTPIDGPNRVYFAKLRSSGCLLQYQYRSRRWFYCLDVCGGYHQSGSYQ